MFKILKPVLLAAAWFAFAISCQKDIVNENSGSSAGQKKKLKPATIFHFQMENSILMLILSAELQVQQRYPVILQFMKDLFQAQRKLQFLIITT